MLLVVERKVVSFHVFLKDPMAKVRGGERSTTIYLLHCNNFSLALEQKISYLIDSKQGRTMVLTISAI